MDPKSKKLSTKTAEVETELKETETPVEEETAPRMERLYSGASSVDSDLFKLKVAMMKKNAALDPKKEQHWVYHEHTHVFRTYDSSARRQEHSSPVGGHFHTVETRQNPAGGVPIVVSVSKALRKVGKIVNGSSVVVTEEVPGDEHTHEVQYERSDKVALRKMDPEAAKFAQEITRRHNPPTPAGAKG